MVDDTVRVHLESLMQMLQQQIQVLFDMLELRLQRKVLSVGASIPSLLVFPGGHQSPETTLRLSRAKKGKPGKPRK